VTQQEKKVRVDLDRFGPPPLEESPSPKIRVAASEADSRDGPDDGLEEYRGFTTHVDDVAEQEL